MAQAFYCPSCKAAYTAELRGRSCPACGDELVHGRVPAGRAGPKRHTGGMGRAVWDMIVRKDPCAYCGRLPGCSDLQPPTGKRVKLHTIDHIQPKALGGSKGHWTNRIGSCRPCNGDKAHTPLLHFMLEQVGEDLDWLKDENGNWPLPPEDERPPEEVVLEPGDDARHVLVALRGHRTTDD